MEQENNLTLMALLTEMKSIQKSFATLQKRVYFHFKGTGRLEYSFYVHVLAEILKESALPDLV